MSRRCECGQYPDVCARYGHRGGDCPDSATCRAVPVRGRCPFHAEHMADREAYAETEADNLRIWRDR